MIRNDDLRAYADLLQANGFTVYDPKGDMGTYFLYSRVVDGRECFGYVQHDYFGGYSHTMPIRPSRENGSSMFVDGAPSELTVHAARRIARPSNRNELVGWQQNYEDPSWVARGYVKRETSNA